MIFLSQVVFDVKSAETLPNAGRRCGLGLAPEAGEPTRRTQTKPHSLWPTPSTSPARSRERRLSCHRGNNAGRGDGTGTPAVWVKPHACGELACPELVEGSNRRARRGSNPTRWMMSGGHGVAALPEETRSDAPSHCLSRQLAGSGREPGISSRGLAFSIAASGSNVRRRAW